MRFFRLRAAARAIVCGPLLRRITDARAPLLAVAQLTTIRGQWCTNGTSLYVYGRRGHVAEAIIDAESIEAMLTKRTESARKVRARVDAARA